MPKQTDKKAALLLTAFGLLSIAPSISAQETFSEVLAKAKPIVESTIRSEYVDQQAIKNKAHALTLRTRIGLQTDEFKGVKALIEFENVTAMVSDYNSNLNGNTAYPVVADPIGTELNRFQFTYQPNETSTLTLGRQRIILDDQRFIGAIAWRQDDQTFDAIRYDGTLGRLTYTAAYVTKVNRVLADQRDWESNSYLLNATYPISEALKLQAFNYNLDFSNAAASSTDTLGVKAMGSGWFGATKWSYLAQGASQVPNANNSAKFDLYESMVEGAITYDMFTFKANYEVLEGDGKTGFIMPLSTAHAFQGWSDVFNATGGNKTHVDGIQNLSLNFTVAGYTWDKLPFFKNPTFSLIYHDLKTERTAKDIGKEWDASFAFVINPKVAVLVKYADFERASSAMPASRTKGWLMLTYKL